MANQVSWRALGWFIGVFCFFWIFLFTTFVMSASCGKLTRAPETRLAYCAIAMPGAWLFGSDDRGDMASLLGSKARVLAELGRMDEAIATMDKAWGLAEATGKWRNLGESRRKLVLGDLRPVQLVRTMRATRDVDFLDIWSNAPFGAAALERLAEKLGPVIADAVDIRAVEDAADARP
jgi:hypothetical protein